MEKYLEILFLLVGLRRILQKRPSTHRKLFSLLLKQKLRDPKEFHIVTQ